MLSPVIENADQKSNNTAIQYSDLNNEIAKIHSRRESVEVRKTEVDYLIKDIKEKINDEIKSDDKEVLANISNNSNNASNSGSAVATSAAAVTPTVSAAASSTLSNNTNVNNNNNKKERRISRFKVSVVTEPDITKLNVPTETKNDYKTNEEDDGRNDEVTKQKQSVEESDEDVRNVITKTYESLVNVVTTSYPPDKSKL